MSEIRIVWDVHYKCNYRCPYCWFESTSDERRLRNSSISFRQWIARWNYLYDKYGPIHIEITGGEPFIYPDFVCLIEEISKIHSIRITTNLSIDIEQFSGRISPERVKIIASFHPSFAVLDSFLDKATALKDSNFLEAIIYVAYPPQIQQVEYLDVKFKERGIVFSVTPFWGKYNDLRYPESYSEKEREMLRLYLGNDSQRLNFTLARKSPKGRLCRAGKNFALLSDNGDVFRCGQLGNKAIGNIFEESFGFLSAALPCESDICPCDDHNYLEETV